MRRCGRRARQRHQALGEHGLAHTDGSNQHGVFLARQFQREQRLQLAAIDLNGGAPIELVERAVPMSQFTTRTGCSIVSNKAVDVLDVPKRKISRAQDGAMSQISASCRAARNDLRVGTVQSKSPRPDVFTIATFWNFLPLIRS